MKKMILGAIILLIIGIIGTTASVFANKDSLFHPKEWSEKKSISGKNIKEIQIDSGSVDVILEPSNSDDVQVDLLGKETIRKKGQYKLKVDNDGDRINIKVKEKIRLGATFYSSIKLYVKIPEKMYQSLDVKSSSGELNVKEFSAENATFKAASGDVNVKNGKVNNKLVIESTSGTIKAANNQAEDLFLKATSGDITNDDVKVANQLSVQVSSGEINVNNNEAKKVKLKSTSGDINVDQLLAKESEINATSGSIVVDDISGTIIGNVTSGDIEIGPNKQVGNMNLESTSGTVEVRTKQQTYPFAIDFNGGSGSGKIQVSGATYTEKNEHEIKGKIGDGSIQLKVKTTSGDFVLK